MTQKALAAMDFILQRLQEPSTWRGIISVLTGFGMVLNPDQSAKVIAGGIALIGLIEMFRKDPPKNPPAVVTTSTGTLTP